MVKKRHNLVNAVCERPLKSQCTTDIFLQLQWKLLEPFLNVANSSLITRDVLNYVQTSLLSQIIDLEMATFLTPSNQIVTSFWCHSLYQTLYQARLKVNKNKRNSQSICEKILIFLGKLLTIPISKIVVS